MGASRKSPRWSRALAAPIAALTFTVANGCKGTPVCEVEPLLGGAWSLTAKGKRRGCRVTAYEGEFELRTAGALEVGMVEAEVVPIEGGGVVCPLPIRAQLALVSPVPGFELAGSVSGEHVSFSTRELIPGDEMRFTFVGKPDSHFRHLVHGTFSGTGPAGCMSEGEFDLDVAGARGPDAVAQPGASFDAASGVEAGAPLDASDAGEAGNTSPQACSVLSACCGALPLQLSPACLGAVQSASEGTCDLTLIQLRQSGYCR